MRDYVAWRRPELAAEARAGSGHLAGMVPQLHEPGAEAEVDFCEALVIVAGKPMKAYLLTRRLSYSGKSVHRVFACQGQEAFMEGHVEEFTSSVESQPCTSATTISSRRYGRCC